MKRSIIVMVIVAGIMSSCSNEINLHTSAPPVPVIYCLLNPDSSRQYVRLSKSYLMNEHLIDQADFTPEPGAVYSLYVYFPENKRMASGRTTVMSKPQVIDPMNVPSRAITFDSLSKLYTRWIPASNGGLYQGIFRFHFAEIQNQNSQNLFVDYPTPIYSVTQANPVVEKQLNPENFFIYLHQQLVPNPDIRRVPIGLEYIFYSTGEDLALWFNTQNDAKSSQNSIFEYTNIAGGKGIFSSWIIQRIPNIPLSQVSIHNLKTHPLTKDLCAISTDPVHFFDLQKRKGGISDRNHSEYR